MRYLFLVGHPAHVHLFRNLIHYLDRRGHEVLVGAVAREVTTNLLDAFRLPYFVFGRPGPGLISKGLTLVIKDLVLLAKARKFGPDMLVSTGSPYGAHVSAILAKPHLIFGDTEHAAIIARLTLPFSDAVCTPEAFKGELGPKHVRYNGSKEIAYLHPGYFTPDPTTVAKLGLSPSEPYIIVRLSAWDASHDLGDAGFGFQTVEDILGFLRTLERYGRVVVTSERGLGLPFNRYDIAIPPERLHDVLAFARLYVGEGATMAAEAGVLGVPWIFVSTTGRGFLEEQEDRYRLGWWVSTTADVLRRAESIFSQPDVQQEWHARRDAMLAEKGDVTRFMAEFIEGWPGSFEAVREHRNVRSALTRRSTPR